MSLDEAVEVELSALMDGELPHNEVLRLIDRVAVDPECREAYLGLRRLERVVADAEVPGSVPARIWRAVRQKAGIDEEGWTWPWLRPVSIPAWALGATAVLVLTLLVWEGSSTTGRGDRLQPGVTIQLELGEDRDAMTDSRFVELTAELLRADPRYHRKMLQVMNQVEGEAFIAEGSGEGGGAGEGRSSEGRSEVTRGRTISG